MARERLHKDIFKLDFRRAKRETFFAQDLNSMKKIRSTFIQQNTTLSTGSPHQYVFMDDHNLADLDPEI